MAALVQRAARKPAPSDAPTPAEAAGSVRVIERTVRILKCLSASGGLTLTELSRDIDLHKATVLRFLRTLERGGLVSLAGGKVWRLGPAFLEMRLRALGQLDLRTVARPFMEAASRASNETVQLATLADHAVLYLEKVEPPDQVLRINSQVGSRRPIHCTRSAS
jgi:DNA-binding IclR family transcriptional regulator